MYRTLGKQWWQAQEARSLGDTMAAVFAMYAAGDALDDEGISPGPDACEINVTGCRYAQFYQELGASELGFLLVCSADFPMAEGFGPDIQLTRIQLTRTQTIMQGASHCDFRYTRRKREAEP